MCMVAASSACSSLRNVESSGLSRRAAVSMTTNLGTLAPEYDRRGPNNEREKYGRARVGLCRRTSFRAAPARATVREER